MRVQESSGGRIDRKYEAPLDLTSDANGTVTWKSKFSLAHDPNRDKTRTGNQALARVEAPGVAVGGAALKAGYNLIRDRQ